MEWSTVRMRKRRSRKLSLSDVPSASSYTTRVLDFVSQFL